MDKDSFNMLSSAGKLREVGVFFKASCFGGFFFSSLISIGINLDQGKIIS